MPIYQCISPEGLLDESTRRKLAQEITRIHCDATGVPPSFVTVMFLDMPDGRHFVAGKPSGHSVLSGAIRVGGIARHGRGYSRTCRRCGHVLPASRRRNFLSRCGRTCRKT
jgi:phenylpyruvate tautomerase PptA (4-oxalocrotonate tautomerase family)